MDELAAKLRSLGPYFAVDTHAPGQSPGDGWLPFDALFEAGPASFAVRVSATGTALATMASVPVDRVPGRVAGSISQLGLAARLVAPVLGAIALTGGAPALEASAIWWRNVLGGPVPLSLTGRPGPAEAAVDAVLSGPVARLVAAGEALAISRTVLWGNVASGLGGAVGQVVLHRPEREDDVLGAAELFLSHPLLAGTYEGTCGFDFRRRSCCLIYQLGPAGPARYCGDCILRTR